MRKPQDIDSELKALEAKAKTLKERRVRQLGELVIACRVASKDTNAKENWRKAGAVFFQRTPRKAVARNDRGAANDAAPDGNAASA